jgi:hypothetical protein
MKPTGKSPPHLLTGTSFFHWKHLCRMFGPTAPSARRRVRKITLGSLFLAPSQLWESLWFGRRVAATPLDPAPVFIIGHWQAGHSFLHYLMCQDEQFGFVNLLHSILPRACLTLEKGARRFLRGKLNKTRHVDSFALDLDSPQGDDMGLAGLSDISIYHAYTFPEHVRDVFDRTVLLEGLSDAEITRWQETYRWFLKKVSCHTGKSRLVLRNGSNTGRIRHVLQMFPQAKFVHLRRNPYVVYAAQSRRWAELLRLWSLQNGLPCPQDEIVLDFFRRMLERFFADTRNLPENQLIDIAYEDLVTAPKETLRRIYRQLELPGFEQAEPAITRYLAENPGRLDGDDVSLDAETCARVTRAWGFAIERWGYSPPGGANSLESDFIHRS